MFFSACKELEKCPIYGIIADEARKYGAFDFEVDFKNRIAEPAEGIY